MKARNATLLWTPGTDLVRVVQRPHGATDRKYERSGLGAYPVMQTMLPEVAKLMCFVEAMHLIVRDKCDPMAVHKALLGVDEYLDGCAGDMPGVNRG